MISTSFRRPKKSGSRGVASGYRVSKVPKAGMRVGPSTAEGRQIEKMESITKKKSREISLTDQARCCFPNTEDVAKQLLAFFARSREVGWMIRPRVTALCEVTGGRGYCCDVEDCRYCGGVRCDSESSTRSDERRRREVWQFENVQVQWQDNTREKVSKMVTMFCGG